MNPIRLHYSLMLDTSECPDPDRAVKQFLEAAGFADKEKSVEVSRGNYVVRYTLDDPETLTELPRVLNHMAKVLFSEATKAAVRNLKERPTDFAVEMYIQFPYWASTPLKIHYYSVVIHSNLCPSTRSINGIVMRIYVSDRVGAP